jgi:hypothetical protein
MPPPVNIPVTSPKAIKSTIQTDPQVARWFEFLITRPALKEKLSAAHACCSLYQQLSRIQAGETTMLALLFSLLCLVVWQPTPLLLLGLFLLCPYFWIKTHKATIVAQISLPLIEQDYPPAQLTVTSLYQISESYAHRYQIPSLVDTIFHLDRTARWAIFTVLVTTCVILPLPLHKQLIYAVIAQLVVVHFLRSDFIYKNLR